MLSSQPKLYPTIKRSDPHLPITTVSFPPTRRGSRSCPKRIGRCEACPAFTIRSTSHVSHRRSTRSRTHESRGELQRRRQRFSDRQLRPILSVSLTRIHSSA